MQRAPYQDPLESSPDSHIPEFSSSSFSKHEYSRGSPSSYKAKGSLPKSWEKGKGRAWPLKAGRSQQDLERLGKALGPSPIARLPVEGLAQVFARLPPTSLEACSLVCRDWYGLIKQDSTWKSAFLYHFSLPEVLQYVPGKRLAPGSWRLEFSLRYELAQKWAKSKLPTITHDPRVGVISMIHANLALQRLGAANADAKSGRKPHADRNAHGSVPTMLSLSLSRGLASRSDPYNGKVAKGGFIEGAPAPALAMLGVNADTVTCAAISKDGSAIVWGMANGSVQLSRSGLGGRSAFGQGQRSAAPSILGTQFHNHFGPVLCMRFLSGTELLATVAVDGVAKLWDCSSGCIWTSAEAMRLENGRIDDCAVLELVQLRSGNALLVAGSRTGLIYAWRLDLKAYTSKDFWKFKASDIRKTNPPVVNESIQELSMDTGTCTLLVQYKDDPCFYRLTWMDRLTSSVACFGHLEEYISGITAMATDFAANSDEMAATASQITSVNGASTPTGHTNGTTTPSQGTTRSFSNLAYVIAGDDQGRTFLWDWNAEEHQDDGVIKPVLQLQGFDTKVTSIKIAQTLFMIGSADGTIRAYDILSTTLIRVFNERSAPRHALRHILTGQADEEEEAKWAVSHIAATEHGFVASIGARILAWRAGNDYNSRKKVTRSGGRLSSRAERYRNDLELRHDIRESTKVLEHESADRIDSFQQLRRIQGIAGVPSALGDMTEDEATALAIMLSQEEEEAKQFETTLDESLEDLEHLRLDEEDFDEDSFALDSSNYYRHFSGRASATPSQSRSLEAGPSFLASPEIRASGSPLSLSYRSASTNKVQLSPRLYPQSYGSPRSPSSTAGLDTLETAAWPLPSPAARTPSPASSPSHLGPVQGATTSTPNKWSDLVKKDSGTISSAHKESTPSLLTRQMPRQDPQDDDIDEELRFVLELSRAEEESRRAAQ